MAAWIIWVLLAAPREDRVSHEMPEWLRPENVLAGLAEARGSVSGFRADVVVERIRGHEPPPPYRGTVWWLKDRDPETRRERVRLYWELQDVLGAPYERLWHFEDRVIVTDEMTREVFKDRAVRSVADWTAATFLQRVLEADLSREFDVRVIAVAGHGTWIVHTGSPVGGQSGGQGQGPEGPSEGEGQAPTVGTYVGEYGPRAQWSQLVFSPRTEMARRAFVEVQVRADGSTGIPVEIWVRDARGTERILLENLQTDAPVNPAIFEPDLTGYRR